MNDSNHDKSTGDNPPYSRIFVVCSKLLQEEDLAKAFERYGTIENMHLPRDKNTGERRGVAFIKYNKTSAAATAIQEMHMKKIENCPKPIKVMIANHKNESPYADELKCDRLFIKVPRNDSEFEIKDYFSAFGHVVSINILKDKVTRESKGLAFVQFESFVAAAKAFEECDKKYKPVFAAPKDKDELKRSRHSLEGNGDYFNYPNNSGRDIRQNESFPRYMSMFSNINNQPAYKSVAITCNPQVNQQYLRSLFDIIPGLTNFEFSEDSYNGVSKAIATYENEQYAAYAVERINNFEFPSGEVVTVKPNTDTLSKATNELTDMVNNFKNSLESGSPDLLQLAQAISQASRLLNTATTGKIESMPEPQNQTLCSVVLPPKQPILPQNSKVAKRCFIVCKPQPPPNDILRDVFCRFGNLIEISTFPNKTFGFAKYASEESADNAISTLNGAVLCGIKLKVLEADEKMNKDGDRTDESQGDRKRPKLY